MDDEIDVADNCQPKTSNLNANVRTKVSSWVTNFVSEMRTKSPAVVQRWVDSLPNESVTNPVIEATSVDKDDLHVNETIIKEFTKDRNDEEKEENCVHASTVQVDDIEKSSTIKHQLESDSNTNSNSATITLSQTESQAKNPIVDNCLDNHLEHQKFWHRGTSILSSLRKRGSSLQTTETDDLNSSVDLSNDETNLQSTASANNTATTTATTATTSQTSTILNKSKLNELYDKLSISRKRYNFITERKMEAKKIINNAKSRFLATSADQQHQQQHQQQNVDDNAIDNVPDTDKGDNNLIVSADALGEASASTSNVCDNIEMDISTDDFSRLSQSNDLLSADDEDSFNISMPSINDGPSQHLSVNRKMIMADIGRSTSDNPRLRNKFYLADIGRSFSEHQDDDAIIISERNISAPTSSIAIQNNNKSNGNFYERRAYSVSPTQRNLKRDVLSRDFSLSDSSRHRHQLSKGSSFQSDSSHCSSVESLLDARKPDPEAILRHLGFGPAHQEDLLSRIPKRFLKPSQVNGIDTETFMRQQQIASNLHEQSILGYRGLVGTPHILPSVIVAKIMERFQLSDEKNTKIYDSFNIERPMSAPPTPGLGEMPNLPHTEP